MNRVIFIAFLVFFFVLTSMRSFNPATWTLSRENMNQVLSAFSIKQTPTAITTENTTSEEVADHVIMHTPSQ
ncbi:MAG: hypothetical protein PHO26_03760 [Dehalococcoidia bacterium]|nr:hypothetical protein [Dehalococcoidia bacterium]MDD5495332.1 hypothetical protein [Dehalococcoidia bacterium]